MTSLGVWNTRVRCAATPRRSHSHGLTASSDQAYK